MEALTQTGPIDDFDTEFNRLARDANITQGAALIALYRQKLAKGIREKIMYMDNPPITIEGWQDKAKQIDRAWRANRAIETEKGNYPKKSMPGKTIKAAGVNKLTQDERMKLLRKGACFYCKEVGHMARECPKKKADGNPQKKKDQSKKTVRATVEDAVDEDDTPPQESDEEEVVPAQIKTTEGTRYGDVLSDEMDFQ